MLLRGQNLIGYKQYPDDVVEKFVEPAAFNTNTADSETSTYIFDAAKTREVTALPGGCTEIKPLSELSAVKIKSVFIGGTTGGTLKELAPAEEEKTETHSLTFEGRCWKFGDDIDTDIIIPTQHLNYETMDEIKTHAFEPLRPDLAAKLREGDLIVAGSNFGCGSSREQAAEVLVANGVHCVIAKSFARIFFRNAINNGILLLECQDLADHVKEGDTIQVDLDNQKITADGKTYAIPAIPENQRQEIALRLVRICAPIFRAYDLKDDFSERPEFRQLKEELRTGIRSWIDENGVPGYHSPARKEKPPAPYSEQPRYSKRNKRK